MGGGESQHQPLQTRSIKPRSSTAQEHMRLQMQEKNARSEKVLEFQNKERGRHVIDTMKKVRELAQERERIIDMVGTESQIAHRKCFVFVSCDQETVVVQGLGLHPDAYHTLTLLRLPPPPSQMHTIEPCADLAPKIPIR